MIDKELRRIKRDNSYTTVMQEIEQEIKQLKQKQHLFGMLELIEHIEKYQKNGVFTQFGYQYINVCYGYNVFTEDNMLYVHLQEDNCERSASFDEEPSIVYGFEDDDAETKKHKMFEVIKTYRAIFIEEIYMNKSMEENKQYIFKLDNLIGENILNLIVTDEMKELYQISQQKINLEEALPINPTNTKKTKI